VVLHELLTGRRPFDRAARADTISAILRDPPVLAASLSPARAGVILRCLEKDPGTRYQRAGEVRAVSPAIGRKTTSLMG
jgi:serine/threonine protein kinase